MSVKTPKPTQAQRYREGKPTAIGNGLELSEFKNCSIFNASTPPHFMAEAKEHLCDVIDGNFVTDQVLAKQTTPSVAEFWQYPNLMECKIVSITGFRTAGD